MVWYAPLLAVLAAGLAGAFVVRFIVLGPSTDRCLAAAFVALGLGVADHGVLRLADHSALLPAAAWVGALIALFSIHIARQLERARPSLGGDTNG